jgi:exodeoxyribonuclease VII small subunit
MSGKSPKKEIQFERSLDRLEEIVKKLEGGNIPLSDAVRMYEEGIKLSNDCLKQLKDVEIKLKKISKELDGSFKVEDLE